VSVTSTELPRVNSVGLRAGALTLMETVGQSLAAIAPTLTPALNISVVAGLAGVGCWLSFFIGTLGVVVVAISVGILAARHPEAGSFFVYVGRTFGPLTGALAGWAMISAYMFTAVAATISFAIFLDNSLLVLRVHLSTPLMAVPLLGVRSSGDLRGLPRRQTILARGTDPRGYIRRHHRCHHGCRRESARNRD
jgi:amino acid transporter